MSKLNIAVTCALGMIVPSFLAQAAFADTWESQKLGGDESTAEQLFAQTSDTTALAFVCSGGKLKSIISASSNDAENVVANYKAGMRHKRQTVRLSIDGEEINKSKWNYNASRDMFMPKDMIVPIKLYNAAVNGNSVSFKRSGRDAVNLTLPAPNSAFISFGGACGIGANKHQKAT